MINPTQTESWNKLFEHFKSVSDLNISNEFSSNPERAKEMSINIEGLHFDYSKNLITNETLELLLSLANEQQVLKARDQMFNGFPINSTENRAVLHSALRDFSSEEIRHGDKDVLREIEAELQEMGKFAAILRYSLSTN